MLLIILFLRRKRIVNVTVTEIKPSRRAEGGVQKWIYTCSVGGALIGRTAATPLQAHGGAVLRVRVSAVREDEEGRLSWWNPEVMGLGEEEDGLETIRRIAKSRKQ